MAWRTRNADSTLAARKNTQATTTARNVSTVPAMRPGIAKAVGMFGTSALKAWLTQR